MTDHRVYIAELLLRILAGILFFFQGYDKLFRIKLPVVADTIASDPDNRSVPRSMLNVLVYFTSVAELIGGIMLLGGVLTTYALYLLGVDLLLVSLAFTYMRPMWNMKYVFPRFVLVVTLLLIPEAWHYYTLDRLLPP
jgi:uncharacterized membrane protein YphA (DoxX/SURF4 family)